MIPKTCIKASESPFFPSCSTVFLSAGSVWQKNKLMKSAITASEIIGHPVPSLSEITDRAVPRKARTRVSAGSSHPLYGEFKPLLLTARQEVFAHRAFKLMERPVNMDIIISHGRLLPEALHYERERSAV